MRYIKIDSLIALLPITTSKFVEEYPVDPSLWISLVLFFLDVKFPSPYRENNNVVVFQFSFHIFVLLANLWFICL